MDNQNIKEILDEFMNFDFNSQGERIEINEYERNILKDYITNLQQENERIKKMNMHEHKYGSDMEEKYLLEKEKNDRAVEYIEKEKSNYMRSCDISNATNREGLIISSAVRTCDDTLKILRGNNER